MDFKINGVAIKPPTTYKPAFATTSTEDSDRTQDGVMHNTPMFTVEGYDLTWTQLTPGEASVILQQVIDKSSFTFYGPSPYAGNWAERTYYASNFSMAAMTLVDGREMWTDLAINIRGVNPL